MSLRRGLRGAAALLLLALLLAGAALRAQPTELAVGTHGEYELREALRFLEDETGQLTLADILHPAQQARFRPVPTSGRAANFGLTSSAIWLRVDLRLATGSDPRWLLELAYAPLDRVELYTPDEAFGYERQVAGDLVPFSAKPVPHRNHVLPVRLLAGGTTTLYLRLASEGTVAAPLRLWRPAALWAYDQGVYAGLSLYFGLLLGLLIYNLLLFASVRDVGYLMYVGFTAAMGIGLAALTGLGGQFLWPEWTRWNAISPPVGLTAAALLGFLFARHFLNSRVRMPRLDRVMLAQMAGWSVALVVALALPYRYSTWLVTALAVLSAVTMVAVALVSIRRGFPGARNFFTAWAVLLLGVVTLSLHNTGVLPSNWFTANSLLIGSGLEMVLLSFALADRINVARRFKEQAQARIAAEQAMVQALTQSQERLRTVLEEREIILESSIVGIAFLTPDGRLRWANRAMSEIFGGEGKGVASMEPFYLSRGQYLQVGAEVAAAVAQGKVYEKELQMRRVDDTPIWVSLSGKAVSRRDLGQGTVWAIMNISERKALEAQLQKTMSEREAILNNAVVGIVLSVDARHEWVNEKFAQMVGHPREALIGQPATMVHPDPPSLEAFRERSRQALARDGSFTTEMQLQRADGTLFWVEMGGSCVRPREPEAGVIWTFLDITERKHSEAEIREALEQQKALNELRSRFVAMTSHEFRTPLAAIRSAEELLRHYGDRLQQHDRVEVLDSIAEGVQRMTRMIDRVLLLGKADAQMLDFEPRPVDLPALCRELVDEAKAQHPRTAPQVVAQWDPAVGPGVYDEKLLRHIFGNLLSNAIKYSPAGGEVRFGVRREGAETVFEVSDRGIGIPPDEIGHLFESFHRASNVGSIQGTGLGLAIVKNAVQMHRGRIEVDSRLGEGTRFTVRLPAQPAPPAD